MMRDSQQRNYFFFFKRKKTCEIDEQSDTVTVLKEDNIDKVSH